MLGDIYPGARVFETGIGSGALSMTMLRWGAHITGLELREDFLNRAVNNVKSFLGEEALSRYEVSLGDSYEDCPEGDFDRVMLDLPEPWRVTPTAEKILVPGGLMVAYTPSITQAVQVRESMGKGWVDQRTLEVLHRTWHIEGMAVRPDHRMVAHTAFLTVARFVGA
jgi:tRNA (adenine57-N1/adenine58-N1)-methyltransferase